MRAADPAAGVGVRGAGGAGRDIQRWDERIRTQLGGEVLTDLRALAARANTMLERGALQIAQNLAAEFETPALIGFKAIDRGAKELRTDVDNRLVVIQRAVRDELEAAFGRLLADLRKAVAQQCEMAAADAKRREQLRKEAQARLLTLQRLRHRLTALSTVVAEITAEPAAGTPALAGPGVMLE